MIYCDIRNIYAGKDLAKIKKKKIKILGLITGFFIAAHIEALGQTLYEGFDDITSLFPILIIGVILAGVFVIIKVSHRRIALEEDKTKVSRPADVWYLVGLSMLVGIYSIALEIIIGEFGIGFIGILAFSTGYFFLASQLWLKKTWAWNASMILAYFQTVFGINLLVSSGWNPMNAMPLIINIAIILALIQPQVLQFYKKEKNVFLKCIEELSDT